MVEVTLPFQFLAPLAPLLPRSRERWANSLRPVLVQEMVKAGDALADNGAAVGLQHKSVSQH